eukprot:SAG11_NODE_1397_length_5032_cov_14.008109_10_plen_301_part_00
MKYYHEAAQHPGGITTWRMIRNKYVWGSPGDMKRQVQNHCDQCTVCQKFKIGNHAPFASPRCTIAASVPFASISGDVFDMPPTVDGYDSILLVVCNWSKYCVLTPMKSKGLTTPSLTRIYPEFEGKTTAWTSEIIAYKLHKRVFSVFGLSLHLRTDGQASLFKGVWPTLMKLLGVDQLVGTVMSSSSNEICERKIKDLRRMFSPIMDRGGAMAWKIATIAVQVAANNIPNENEMTPEQNSVPHEVVLTRPTYSTSTCTTSTSRIFQNFHWILPAHLAAAPAADTGLATCLGKYGPPRCRR